MPTARQQILHDIRSTLPVEAALPALANGWIRYDDPREQFLEMLGAVGGAGKVVAGRAALRQEIERVRDEVDARQVCSIFPEVVAGNVDLTAIRDPHQLADVDLSILPGELAVAENAAVWVTDARVCERVLYFLSQHVVLVLPAERIVHNMHEAYQWLHEQAPGGAGPFDAATWGTFMSGPSKTADIEQALVIGAHGARSLHVFLTMP